MKNILFVAGMSGAGKSTVMSILEDMGYQCIDQIPTALIGNLVSWLEESVDPRYSKVALSTTMIDLPKMYQLLEDSKVSFSSVFLDAGNEQLLMRYKFTKHKHPMILEGLADSLEDAIELERQIWGSVRDFKGTCIDTSNLSITELKRRMEGMFSDGVQTSFMITFVSFGYKYGVPKDADLLFDVRFLPNPYWEPSLRKLNGDDPEVYDYVMEKQQTKEYLAYLTAFIDYLLPQYEKEGRNHLTIGIGCTGGQHRSMTLVNYLYNRYSTTYKCLKDHREQRGE
ncbi:MAG: RNase adapter RapZ [Erysipelotrichaceae bacterium]|nr:RNase adapter RapZ [Erysipelotrichaceae bacterium]